MANQTAYVIYFHNPMYGDNPSAWRIVAEMADLELARQRGFAELQGKRDFCRVQVFRKADHNLMMTMDAKQYNAQRSAV